MKTALAIIAALALTGCERARSNSAEDGADAALGKGEVALYAVAPDGTKLWAVEGRNARTVYFATSGTSTSHNESCGKNCNQTVDDVVPAGRMP